MSGKRFRITKTVEYTISVDELEKLAPEMKIKERLTTDHSGLLEDISSQFSRYYDEDEKGTIFDKMEWPFPTLEGITVEAIHICTYCGHNITDDPQASNCPTCGAACIHCTNCGESYERKQHSGSKDCPYCHHPNSVLTFKQIQSAKTIADYNSLLVSRGIEPEFLPTTFKYLGTVIYDPFRDESLQLEVNPTQHYGVAFLTSSFIRQEETK